MTETTSQNKIVFNTKIVKIPIPFFADLAALTNQTVVSNPISTYFKVIGIEAHFRDDTSNLVRVGVYSANNRNAPTTTPPPDNAIISSLSPTAFLIGEGEIISLPCSYEPEKNFQYIKVYFSNGNNYAMTCFAVVTIEARLQVPADANGMIPTTEELLNDAGKYQNEALAKTRAIIDGTTDGLKGTHPSLRESERNYKTQASKINNGLFTRYMNLSKMDEYVPPDSPLEDRAKFSKAWLDKVLEASNEIYNNSFLTDVFTSSLGAKAPAFGDFLENCFGTQSQAKQVYTQGIETAILKPTQQYWNNLYAPNLPDVSDLINMVVKEVISLDQFKKIMRLQGMNEEFTQNIWDAHFIQPAFGDIQRAIWKGSISHDEIEMYLKRVDLDPRYNESVWFPLLENTPNMTDSINMLTKEVITQEQFNTLISRNGFSSYWGSKFWDAHFNPSNFTDFITAMRRKTNVNIPNADGTVVSHQFGLDIGNDDAVVKRLSGLADYDPRYWDFFKTRMYNDATPRMAMWAYEANAINEETLRETIHRFGYTPDVEKWYGDMLIHFRERAWQNRYLTKLITAYTTKALSFEEIQQQVIKITNSPNIAGWIQQLGDLEEKIKATGNKSTENALISIGELKQMYILGVIDGDKFLYELRQKNFIELDIQLIKTLIDKQKEATLRGGQKLGLTVAELFDAYKYSEITRDSLINELRTRNMDEFDIHILIRSKEKKWGMETA